MRALRLVVAAAILLASCLPRRPSGTCGPRRDLVVAVPAMPTDLDWSKSHEVSWSNYPVLLTAMDGLVRLDEHNTVAPALAERWEVDPHGDADGRQRYVFHLRAGVVWSDGKTPLVAADFVTGWKRALVGAQGLELADLAGAGEVLRLLGQPPSPERQAALDAALAAVGVEALDDRTLRVTLESPRSYFLARLANVYTFYPQPSGVLAGKSEAELARYFNEPDGAHPLVVGPYRIAEWDRVAKLVRLDRNPHYWGGSPADAPQSLTLVEAELAPVLYDMCKIDSYTLDDPAALASPPPDAQAVPLMSVYWMGMNATLAPELRLAIAHAVDRAAIARDVPGARAAGGWLPDDIGVPGAVTPAEPFAEGFPRHDPARARQLLAASGYDGRELTLLVRSSGTFLPEIAVADAVRAQLGAVGIKVAIRTTASFSNDVKGADGRTRVDLFLRRTGADYAHPQSFFSLFVAGGNHNTDWHREDDAAGPRELDELLRRGALTGDAVAQKAIFTDAQALLLVRRPVVVPLFYPSRFVRRRPWLTGLRVDPFNFLSLRDIRVAGAGAPPAP